MEEIGTKDWFQWLEGSPFPELSTGEVHVWRLRLKEGKDGFDAAVLSAEERRRAEAFHFEGDRMRYSVTRRALRRLLGRYLGEAPGTVGIVLHPEGKPFVRGGSGLCFNVSHSHDVALLAFSRGVEVGVDVEYRREEVEVEELAERFFALEERRAVAAALGDDKRKVFFDIWSAKEACMKAAGAGLGIPLDAFSAASAVGGRGGVVELPLAERKGRFRLYPVPRIDGYAAALAVESTQEMRLWFGIYIASV